ncbi:hypothetical protein ANN_16553 [Periplaneta americana]|uniref:Reverse transcriptase domain-containing protein n=1 Tax=Periplaneta americana TaxID=6978 RepID=A0ABQ8SS87_PERAM|nr:hypothetical protein ANN_16553 [Periplaneta americana]
MKILLRILNRRLYSKMKEQLEEEQFGFRKGKGYLESELNECNNAGEMSPGTSTESYPAFAQIGLRENPGKDLNQLLHQLKPQDCRKRANFCDEMFRRIDENLSWLFNNAVSTTSVDGIGDGEMVFDEMKPKIRHRLPDIRLTVGENLRKNPTRTYIYALNIVMRQLRMICDAAVNKKPAHTSFQADRFLLCNPPRRFSIPS